MTAYDQNLVIEQGSTFSQAFIAKDENGNPVDLTGYTAKMQVRAWPEINTILLDFSNSGNSITLDAQGNVILTASATNTAALAFGAAVYDVLLINGDIVTRFVTGRVTLNKSITR